MMSADDLHADHLGLPLALDPTRPPDALSHARCNTYAGRALQLLLAGHTPQPHSDEQLESVRVQVLAQWASWPAAQHTAAPRPEPRVLVPRSSRDW